MVSNRLKSKSSLLKKVHRHCMERMMNHSLVLETVVLLLTKVKFVFKLYIERLQVDLMKKVCISLYQKPMFHKASSAPNFLLKYGLR